MTTINDILDWDDARVAQLTDAQVDQLGYALKYFEFGFGYDYTARRGVVMNRLRGRYAEIQSRKESEKKPQPVEKMVRCACGHTIPAHMVMRASRGTSCPDCYDEMSD